VREPIRHHRQPPNEGELARLLARGDVADIERIAELLMQHESQSSPPDPTEPA
jgi:hypothetical protein